MKQKSPRTIFSTVFPDHTGLAALIGIAILLGFSSGVMAQIVTDNFDSGVLDTSASGWQERNVLQPLGGYVNDSFVANGTGKAFRIQRGSADMSALGVPQAYGTGRAWLFRTNDYTDFYVAMDLVNWNDETNQAIVLLARGSGFDDTLQPGYPPGLGTVNGYVCNYDNKQDGTGSGDRRGGEFQINVVNSESPSTLAAAEVTLIPGHTYRQVFKGVGSTLTGQLYDIEDLSKPIVTIVADDASFTSGKSGIVTFHRDDDVHPNRTDMTVDNYYSGVADPNAAIAPAIKHPLSGVPVVVTRTPTNRFTNFHPASSGVSFNAQTFTSDQINASATKLYLNGVDVSTSLTPFPANGASASFTTTAGTLNSNTVYSARIELQDTTGTLRSTNTFWFDTFTDSYLTNAPVRTVECEEYNYSNGVYQLDPIPVSGYDVNGSLVNGNGVGYVDLVGTPEIDYHDNGTSPDNGWNDFRSLDYVSTLQGNREDIEDSLHPPPTTPPWADPNRPNDNQRQKYIVAGVKEYEVGGRTEAGEWLNYTRVFANTNYYVYLRCGSFGAQPVKLDKVTSSPSAAGQTTAPLGAFYIPNQLMRLNYQYQPLMAAGSTAVVNLAGTSTIRLTMGGTPSKDNRLLSLNYLLFVPTSAALTASVVLESASIVSGPYANALGASVDESTKTITVPMSGAIQFYRLRSDSAFTITSTKISGGNVILTYN